MLETARFSSEDGSLRAAVVTGGCSGIGRACVGALASAGYAVLVADVRETTFEMLRAEAAANDWSVTPFLCDVADADAIDQLASVVNKQYGRLDTLVNNVGVDFETDVFSVSAVDSWDQAISVNLRSAFLLSQKLAPTMGQGGGGAIVNVSSIMARHTASGHVPYTTSKAGLEGMTRALAVDLGKHGIRVNAVAPGYVQTEGSDRAASAAHDDPYAYNRQLDLLHPMGKRGQPKDIAAVVAFLVSEAARFVNATTVVVDGGLTARLLGPMPTAL